MSTWHASTIASLDAARLDRLCDLAHSPAEDLQGPGHEEIVDALGGLVATGHAGYPLGMAEKTGPVEPFESGFLGVPAVNRG